MNTLILQHEFQRNQRALTLPSLKQARLLLGFLIFASGAVLFIEQLLAVF